MYERDIDTTIGAHKDRTFSKFKAHSQFALNKFYRKFNPHPRLAFFNLTNYSMFHLTFCSSVNNSRQIHLFNKNLIKI